MDTEGTEKKSGPAKRAALGRGLSALLPGAPAPRGLMQVSLDQVSPERNQPRRHFDLQAIRDLAASIKAKGVLQPILVRRAAEGGYRIIAGERRWRAARHAGLSELPIIVKEISETEAFEVALIENIQREDLNPLEEAEAYQRLLTDHGLTQEALAERVGKDRSTIANSLRLLRLPDPVRGSLEAGDLSVGHAKVLLGLEDVESVIRLGAEVATKGLSVRETERLVQKARARPSRMKENPEPSQRLFFLVKALERELRHPCEVRLRRDGSGELTLAFGSDEGGIELLERLVGAMVPASKRAQGDKA